MWTDRRRRPLSAVVRFAVVTLGVLFAVASAESAEAQRSGKGGGRDESQGGQGRGKGDGDGGKERSSRDQAPPGEKGEGDDVIVDSPFEALEISCVAGTAAACRQAGLAWLDASPRQAARAEPLLSTGCRFGDSTSCLAAARLYLDMEVGLLLLMPEGVPSVDLGTAADLLSLGCDHGSALACGLAGDLHLRPEAMLPEGARGRDLEEDLLRALQSYERGCPDGGEADARSCSRLAELYNRGHGVRKDKDRALSYQRRACALAPKLEGCAELAAGSPAQSSTERRTAPEQDAAAAPSAWGRTGDRNTSKPTVDRFQDGARGATTLERRRARIDFRGGVGARWTWVPGGGASRYAGLLASVGSTLWANVVGFGFDAAFTTDHLFPLDSRDYVFYLQGLSVRLAIPLPVDLPISARLVVEPHAAFLFGAFRAALLAPVAWALGARQGLAIHLSSAQERGARQWFGIEVAVDEMRGHRGDGVEVAQAIMLVVGFSGGAFGPEWPGTRPWDGAPAALGRPVGAERASP